LTSREFGPLAAVHIADILEYELRPDSEDEMPASQLDIEFIREIGMTERLDDWRALKLTA
jgi:hypothetical protein